MSAVSRASALRATIALGRMYNRPRLDVALDGELLASEIADENGRYAIDLQIPADQLGDGWSDLYLVFNSVSDPERDSRDPRVAALELVVWTPAP